MTHGETTFRMHNQTFNPDWLPTNFYIEYRLLAAPENNMLIYDSYEHRWVCTWITNPVEKEITQAATNSQYYCLLWSGGHLKIVHSNETGSIIQCSRFLDTNNINKVNTMYYTFCLLHSTGRTCTPRPVTSNWNLSDANPLCMQLCISS